MTIRWFGQSAFLLTADDGARVAIDPFGDVGELRSRLRFDYPPIDGVEAELLLITHEHFDHSDAGRIGGSPHVVRSTAGTFETPLGEVIAIASEHDDVAGTQRGPNTIFVFTLDGVRMCHFGDFGQHALRPEQRLAIDAVDVVFLPVGGGATIGGAEAAAVARELAPRVLVPMHYRTDAVDFLEPLDAFLAALGAEVDQVGSEFELRLDSAPVVLPAAPLG